ncbi:MAG: sulfatase-like hydrolase/transferase [Rikenellaceae bacterium]
MRPKLTIAATLPLLALSTMAYGAPKQKSKSKEEKPKNVIFIIADDMRLDMTAYGGGKLQTPNIDELKSESVNFANACTTTGLSSPSRAALFTGRLGHRTGLEDNLHLWHCESLTLDKEHSTIYEWASEANYNVAYFGKWHLGYVSPADRGAEQSAVTASELTVFKSKRPDYDAIKRYYPDENGVVKEFEEKPEYYTTLKTPYEKSEAKKQVDLSVKFLEERDPADERPIFLTVSFHTPHPSYKVPTPWNHMYDYRNVDLPESLKNEQEGLEFQHDILWPWMDVAHMSDDDWRKTISYSMGLCTMFDKALGELFDKLKEEGLWDDTLIVFTSDQGTMLAEHGLYDKGPYAYDGLMKIPMLVKMPQGESREIEHQVSLIDLNQTLVEYMGLQPTDANLDSRSLLPLLERGDQAWSDVPDYSFYRYEKYNGRWFGVRTIRTPEFKYSFNPNGSDQLYDLVQDPHEMTNLIDNAEYKQTLKTLRVELLKHLRDCDDMKSYDLMSKFTKTTL